MKTGPTSTIRSFPPTACASSRLHSARDCRRFSIPALTSKPGASCPPGAIGTADRNGSVRSSSGPNLSDQFRRTADFVAKILLGTKPGDIL